MHRSRLTTLAFAAVGATGALLVGLVGGLVLSDAAWSRRPPRAVRLLRLALRGGLVLVRSVHELVWALLLVTVLGLDPLVAVLALVVPFGAQTAQVFATKASAAMAETVRTRKRLMCRFIDVGMAPRDWEPGFAAAAATLF